MRPLPAPTGRWVNDGDLRYFDKKISPAVLARSGLQLSGLANARGRKDKILRNADLFKYRAENNQGLPRFSSRSDLLTGGDKSTQDADIDRAIWIAEQWEEES